MPFYRALVRWRNIFSLHAMLWKIILVRLLFFLLFSLLYYISATINKPLNCNQYIIISNYKRKKCLHHLPVTIKHRKWTKGKLVNICYICKYILLRNQCWSYAMEVGLPYGVHCNIECTWVMDYQHIPIRIDSHTYIYI